MNQRFEVLLYHAGLTAQGCWDGLDDYTRQGIEKFAELIVKECAKVAHQNTPDYEELDYSHLIKDKVLEHFGGD